MRKRNHSSSAWSEQLSEDSSPYGEREIPEVNPDPEGNGKVGSSDLKALDVKGPVQTGHRQPEGRIESPGVQSGNTQIGLDLGPLSAFRFCFLKTDSLPLACETLC